MQRTRLFGLLSKRTGSLYIYQQFFGVGKYGVLSYSNSRTGDSYHQHTIIRS